MQNPAATIGSIRSVTGSTDAIRERIRSRFIRTPWHVVGFSDEETGCVAGFTVERGPGYRWDGMLRPRLHPDQICLLQWSLAGWGRFQAGSGNAVAHRVLPGQAFCCLIPSEHRYWLPSDASEWQVAWVLFHHPYAMERIRRCLPPGGAVIDPGSDLRLGNALLQVFATVTAHRGSHDRECALIALALEVHRHLSEAVAERHTDLLQQVRSLLQADPMRPPTITELAIHTGLSRTRFSRRFSELAGMSPGRFALRLRLERAGRLLLTTRLPIAEVARQCGFKEPSHFSKSFLRQMGMAPHSFREGTGLVHKSTSAG